MQEASLSRGGWLEKSKLAMEEGVAKDGFNKDDDSYSDTFADVLGGFDYDSDGDKEENS